MVEAMLSVALRLDKSLRQEVYPLVQADMRWCIRTYLPHVLVYVSFTPNGILIDSSAPEDEGEPDVIISGSLMAIIRSVISSDERIVSKLQFRGEQKEAALSRELLCNLGFQRVFSNLLGRLRQVDNTDVGTSEQSLLITYKNQLDEQQKSIDTLSVELDKANARIEKQKRTSGILGILFAITTLILITVLCINYL